MGMITIDECIELPAKVDSEGLWDDSLTGITFSLPLLEVQMVLIFVINEFFHYFLKRYGVPKFTSQLLVGLVLGSSLLGRLEGFKSLLFSVKSQQIIDTLTFFNYTLFLFLIGVKMNLGMVTRAGRKALFTGLSCILSPILIGLLVMEKLRRFWKHDRDPSLLPILTLLESLTPFPVLLCLLEDLRILHSELGRLSLSAALVTDCLSMCLSVAANFTRDKRDRSNTTAAIFVGSLIAYLIAIVFAVRPAMLWVVRQTPAGRPVKDIYINTIILMVLGSGLLSHSFGQEVLFGPFILGLAVPDGPPLGSALVSKFNCVISELFLPLFVTTCAMRADLSLIKFNNKLMVLYGVAILVTFVAKMLGCLVPALYAKLPLKDALALALLLNCKGVIQLLAFAQLRDRGDITDQTFALSFLNILLTASLGPVLVKFIYDPSRKFAGYKERDIIHCRDNEELRILVCIHSPDNVAAVTKLLADSSRSTEKPFSVYVLHLIELIGRAAPTFISHQMQKKTLSNSSYSNCIILAFDRFKRENQAVVSVNLFTAISSPKFMHEDISMLVVDKLISLVIVPFHIKWSIHGAVETVDSTIRSVNCGILELAACSVGILADRGHLGRLMVSSESSFSVAMIFIGGNDDREALAFAKRKAKDPKLALTVVHFVAAVSDGGDAHWDRMLDSEVLHDVKFNSADGTNVTYLEEKVKDGPQTALKIRSMANNFDLIIAGRRHKVESSQTSGLADWVEFPELGIIGDLLTSACLNTRASVLVVQQQKKMA